MRSRYPQIQNELPGFPPNHNPLSEQDSRDAGALLSVSVVICTRDRAKQLETCLRGLAEVRYPQYEVIVVNNGSSEAQIQEIAFRFHCRYLYEPIKGLSRARNAAVRVSSSDIIAYLDDDAVPDPQWLDHLIQEFQDPEVVAATGRVDPIPGITESEVLFGELTVPVSERSRRVSIDRGSKEWFEKANFGGVGIGCNMAIRRSAWSSWPGFDERLGRGALIDAAEEHFAFFSLIERGCRVVYTPEATVSHAAPPSMDEFRKRFTRDLSAATAYISLLFFEFPQHRRAVIRFVLARLRKSPREWRERRPLPLKIIPKWRALIAMLYGPFLYLWARLTAGTRPGGC